MNPFALLAPLFLIFEIAQLVVSERYLGLRQIRLNTDPRELPIRSWVAATWSIGIIFYYLWMILLLTHAIGRVQGLVLLAVTFIGYTSRAATSMKWTLVILTFEGALRVGMLLYLMGATWRAMGS